MGSQMADAELAIAQKVLQLLRSGNLVRGDKSLDEAEVLAFEQSTTSGKQLG
jgi:hypothetical protein